MKNRRVRIISAQILLETERAAGALSSCDHDGIRAAEFGERFPQSSQGEDLTTSKWRKRVNEHNIHLPLEAHVLKAIIQDHDVGAKALLKKLPGLQTIRSDPHRRNAGA